MPRKRLGDGVRLDVLYEDETPFGSAVGGGARPYESTESTLHRAVTFITVPKMHAPPSAGHGTN